MATESESQCLQGSAGGEDVPPATIDLATNQKVPQVELVQISMLQEIAKTGQVSLPWDELRPVLILRLEQVLKDFCQDLGETDVSPVEQLKQQIISSLGSFSSAPFTTQRFCELLLEPSKHYHDVMKYLRGLEKLVQVTSTIHSTEAEIRVFGARPQEEDTVETTPPAQEDDVEGSTVPMDIT